MDDLVKKLRHEMPRMMAQPYFNVANMSYVETGVAKAAADRIEELERKLAGLEAYLDSNFDGLACG